MFLNSNKMIPLQGIFLSAAELYWLLTIFQSECINSAPKYSTNVANPSFSQRSSHHPIVTKLPNHYKCQNESMTLGAILCAIKTHLRTPIRFFLYWLSLRCSSLLFGIFSYIFVIYLKQFHKAFSKFCRRHSELISKYYFGLETPLQAGLSEPEFYGDCL